MSTIKDYPCDEAIHDLEVFFKKHIKNTDVLNEFLVYLSKCKKSQKIGFRYIHEELMKYRKKSSDYFDYTDEEEKMIDRLFYFWG